jgi:heptosyltransferase-2
MKIVVRVPNWIGDVIFALPALDSLRAAFPGAEIWLAGAPWAGDLLSGGAFDGRAIPFSGGGGIAGARAAARALAEHRFDLGLLLTNSIGSALVFALAKIPRRWGYERDGRSIFLTKGVKPVESEAAPHMVHFYLRLLEGLGLPTLPPEIRLSVLTKEREAARAALDAGGADPGRPLAVLNPGAAYGPAKRWPAGRFAELARLLQDRKGMDIAVTGAAGDAGLAAEIGAILARKPIDLTGRTTLRGLLGVLGRAALVVTNDTGPMHMANALRVPVVGVFGPTDPAATAPFHPPSAVVKQDGIVCWPCLYRACPYDHRCMTAVAAEDVFAAAGDFLE